MENVKRWKLRAKIIEKYGTLKAFAKALDISETALSKRMTTKCAITDKEIMRMSDLLEIAPEEIGLFYFT